MDESQTGSALCAVCGTTIRPEDRYCPSCGTPNPRFTPAATELPPQPSAPPPAEPRPPSASFTAPSATPAQSWTPQPPPRSSNRNTWLIVGGIALFFILVCCCCALLIALSSSQDSALREELEGTAQIALTVI